METKVGACIFILILFQLNRQTLGQNYKMVSPKDLKFHPGDIIACVINQFATHKLLGSYNRNVIHAPGTVFILKFSISVFLQSQ